jgi:outer membrane protein TolC
MIKMSVTKFLKLFTRKGADTKKKCSSRSLRSIHQKNTLRRCASAVKLAAAQVILLCGVVQAQERLTLEDAIGRTLKHNFDISMADVTAQQAARNNTWGNAGAAPNISVGASATVAGANVYSELANGNTQSNPHSLNTNINPALLVNWTIFDGGKMFLVKKYLSETQALTEVQLKEQVQRMVSRTIQMYSLVVLQQKQLKAADTAIFLAKVRMQITNLKYETGAGAKVDYLQALVDYNSSRADSLNYLSAYAQASDSLAVLMGENDNQLYLVDNDIQLNTHLEPVDKERLQDINLTLSGFRRSAELSHLNADIAKTYMLPSLSLAGGYAYSRSTNATGFALFSRYYGPNGTLNLSMPLFQGGNLRRQAKVASLQAMKDELLYEKQNSVIGKQYRTAWRSYQLAVAAYNLAVENIGYSKENLEVQLARFRVGVGTTLESKEAENSFVQALVRLYTAQYNVKVNETIVLELENKLVVNQ